MKERIVQGNETHEKIRLRHLKIVKTFAGDDPREMLAVASILVGQLLAWQDQTMPKQVFFEIIQRNIEMGNASVIQSLVDAESPGGTQ